MILTTHHMSGAGNAFVVIDARHASFLPNELQSVIPALCVRAAVNLPDAEGVILLTGSGQGSATSLFFNPDGSTGAMCGNGGRCLVRFALDSGSTLDDNACMVFTMAGTTYSARVTDAGNICVKFPPPKELRTIDSTEVSSMYSAKSPLQEAPQTAAYVNVGSDHVVLLLNDGTSLWDQPLEAIALPIRHNTVFKNGTNVNIASIVDRGRFSMRTFERGVEGETGACGTGAISTAIALWRAGCVDDSVSIEPTSRKSLHVHIEHADDVITSVTLCGDAVYDCTANEFDTSTGTYL